MFEYSDAALQKLINGIFDGSISEYDLPVSLYNAIARSFENAVYDGFGQTLADAVGKDYELLAELRENTWLFSAAKTFQQTKEMTGLLIDEDGNVRTAREFNKLGRETFEQWNNLWGTTEYNTAIGQAQSASKWNEIEKNAKVLPMLRYSAVLDKNTSDICKPLDGIVAPIGDKIWGRVAPLNHFRCRCVLLQEDGTVEPTPSEEKERTVKEVIGNMQPLFIMNPGKDGYVFSPDHPYFQVEAKDKAYARRNFDLPIPKAPKENESTSE